MNAGENLMCKSDSHDFLQWTAKDISIIKQLCKRPLDLRKHALTVSAKGYAKELDKEIIGRLAGDIT